MSLISATAALPTSSRAQACIAWLRDYACQRINSRLIDERRTIAPSVVLDFGNQGLLGMQVPLALGGKLGLSVYETLKVQRQIAAIDLTLAFFVGSNNALGIRPVLKFGSSGLQQRLLPELATGRMIAAFSLTESGAGSNPVDIRTKARQIDADAFMLNGAKVWAGSASWAGVINVFANLVSADGKPRGHVAFCVPANSKGMRQGPEALTMGLRGMVQNAIAFDDVMVSSENVLGELGGGLAVASDTMMAGRLGIAATCVGGMWRALQLANRYVYRRRIASERLIDSDLVRAKLASLHAAVLTADSLVDRLAQDADQGCPVPPEAYAIAKAICSEWLWEGVDSAIQMTGGRGYMEPNHLAQMLRDARITRIFEGPTDTLLMFVGKRVLEAPQGLAIYMTESLGAVEAQNALGRRLASLNERYPSSSGCRNQHYLAAGEMAALHLACACIKSQACQQWLDSRIARAADVGGRAMSTDGPFGDLLHAEIVCAIGDIEQSAADEDRMLDPYFCRDFAL